MLDHSTCYASLPHVLYTNWLVVLGSRLSSFAELKGHEIVVNAFTFGINIGVRAGGGGRGGLQLPPPPQKKKFWATQIFWAAREIWAKPVLRMFSGFFFNRLIFSMFTLNSAL